MHAPATNKIKHLAFRQVLFFGQKSLYRQNIAKTGSLLVHRQNNLTQLGGEEGGCYEATETSQEIWRSLFLSYLERCSLVRDWPGLCFLGVGKMSQFRTLAVAVAFVLAMPFAAYADNHGQKKDIVDIAVANGSFKTLTAALKAADLVKVLKSKGPFTVFAPTDAAFAALPKGTVEDLLKPKNKAKLVAILKHHVVPGSVASKSIAGKRLSPKTVNGTKLKIDARKGVMVGGANVVKADIMASNGIIHVVDKVILP